MSCVKDVENITGATPAPTSQAGTPAPVHALGHLRPGTRCRQLPPRVQVLGWASPRKPASRLPPGGRPHGAERSGRGCGAGTHAPQVPRRQLESERGRHAWDGDVRVSPASALGAQRPHRTFWCPLADGLALSDSRGALEKCSLWSPRALRSSSRTAEVNFLTRHSVVTTAKSKL